MSKSKTFSRSDIRPDWLVEQHGLIFARDLARLNDRSSEFVSVPCPACKSKQFEAAYEKAGFKYLKCSQCATVYNSPRPPEDLLKEYYINSENYEFWATQIYPATEETRCEKIHEPRLHEVLQHYRDAKIQNGVLVEIGAGYGSFAKLAASSGAFEKVIAVEPVPKLAAACRDKKIDVIEKTFDNAAAQIPKADVIVAFEVIEHLFSPETFIATAFELLKPNGLLICSCPNSEGFDILVLGASSTSINAEQLNLFNPTSLSLLLEQRGFATLDVRTPGNLDADIVREAALNNEFDLSDKPFLKKVLLDNWERCGDMFQHFLASSHLSSHLWCVAQKK